MGHFDPDRYRKPEAGSPWETPAEQAWSIKLANLGTVKVDIGILQVNFTEEGTVLVVDSLLLKKKIHNLTPLELFTEVKRVVDLATEQAVKTENWIEERLKEEKDSLHRINKENGHKDGCRCSKCEWPGGPL